MNNSPNKCSKILVDFRISHESIQALERLGFNVYLTQKNTALYDAVCGHTDMLMCKIGNTIVAEPLFYGYLKNISDLNVRCGETRLCEKYPYDIAYNAAYVGKYLIHNIKYTDPQILKLTDKHINVRQGYTKCSICKVCDEAIITADAGIEKAVFGKLDVLKIREGFIKLDSMNYGFIGGCSGLIDKNVLAFNGCIKKHPDYENIRSFCANHHVDIILLNNDDLYDIGSIITI